MVAKGFGILYGTVPLRTQHDLCCDALHCADSRHGDFDPDFWLLLGFDIKP